ncbi:hypothetical protein [Streptomyces sp. NPDC002845]
MPADPDAVVRRRVGVLLPWANMAVEEELPQLGEQGVVFHYARLVPASRTTAVDDSFWHGLRAASASAVDSMRHLPLDATVLACTSAGRCQVADEAGELRCARVVEVTAVRWLRPGGWCR